MRGYIHVAQQITLAFEADCGHTIGGWVPLDHLTIHELGEVGVAAVVRVEEGDLGVADDMGVLSADGHELSDASRHLLLGYKLFSL